MIVHLGLPICGNRGSLFFGFTISMSAKISSFAQVHPKSELGSGVQIGSFAIVEEGAQIGDNCVIHPGAQILSGTILGAGCEVHAGAILGNIPQDLKFHGEQTSLIIGEHTTIREYVTIHRGTQELGYTKIGDYTLIMAYSHIAHDCVIGNHCVLSNMTQLAGHVIIEDYAVTAGMTGARQFCRIGRHAYLAGGTSISKDVPPYSIVMYTPGNYAGVNIVGLRRRNISAETIQQISDIYKLIYFSEMNLAQALESIRAHIPDTELRQEILHFMQNSKNGVVKKTATGGE